MEDPHRAGDDLLYAFGPFVADPVRRLLRRQGEIVPLPTKAFEVLIALIERHGRLVNKDELLKVVWPDAVVDENNLARHISTLRKVFHEERSEHEYIVTIVGQGYRFVASVHEVPRAEPQTLASISPAHVEDAPAPPRSVETTPGRNATPVDAPAAAARQPKRALIGLVAALLLSMSFIAVQALRSRSGERLSVPHRKLWQVTFTPGVQSEPTWSPDGQWIAYSSDRAGNSDIWVQPITEEKPVRLTSSDDNDWQPAWSPDSNYLAFRSERDGGGLYIVPAKGGTERKIADFGYRPQWSRDGSQILFSGPPRSASSISTELYVIGLAGGPPRKVLSDLLADLQSFQASWYPDGRRISVYGTRRGSRESGMWTASLSGDAVQSNVSPAVAQHLKEADVRFTHFVWSPAGDALFFEGSSQDVTNIWRVTVDPSTLGWIAGPDRLTTGAELDKDISVSSDGTKIAFSLRSEKTRLWSLPFDAVAGRTTGPGEPLTAEGGDAPYDVSSDGTQLVYRAIRQGQQELWKRSLVSGGGRLLLTAGLISAPRWSRDGTRLVYRRDQPAQRPGSSVEHVVAIRDSNGGDERLLTTPRPMRTDELMALFDWSADGAQILSACPDGQTGNIGICSLSSAPHDQAEAHVITSRPGYHLYEAQFSPDSRWICFNATTAEGTSAIYVIPTSGGEWTAITDGRFWGDKPRWAPDGRTIYFTLTRGGFFNVWGRRFDPELGTPVSDPFSVTRFETPSRMLLPRVTRLLITLVRNHLILPLTDVDASIWVLDNVKQ